MTQDHPIRHALADAVWRASSYSGGQGNCVEVANHFPALVPVRDSKHSTGPAVVFTPHAWRAFITHLN
ncbi:DUF397 domain-containing protein [Streptomyces acidiscabies]|uniref:DUF397 domain-containing protein n=1 Tax=Streptomyces acidiscabies TaxID=42234 RepID=UPI000951F71B|nr:DUF397 domain-containing protein [Streptomyces acidiscabies]GAV42211.1 hypothetical protein Saa2_05133 [Streptomyces acidiscabies]